MWKEEHFNMEKLTVILALVAAANAFYSANDDVVELTPDNFQKMVTNSPDLWYVEFYAPWCGHCQSLTPEWKKAATALKGIVRLGAVNADEHKSLGSHYMVKGFPTIKIFGAEKSRPMDYSGGRTAQNIVENALGQVKVLVNGRLSGKYTNKDGGSSSGSSGGSKSQSGGSGSGKVIELTDSNFEKMVLESNDMWLVEFYAPWCGHCKNLAPHWETAAKELGGKVKLGALDATVHQSMASRYGVRGYPTIKYFPAGSKSGDADEYDGGRTSDDIVNWALDKVTQNIAPPELLELTAEDSLSQACDSTQLCIIAVLPHILDCQSECRNKYIDLLKQMADKHKKRMWGWGWVEGGSQMELEEALGIGGFGYPAMAAINARKMKYSLLRGSFGETGIGEFLRELGVGRGVSVAPMKDAKLPAIIKTEPWDGKDGQMPEIDDIDLSDVDLDDLDDINKDEL